MQFMERPNYNELVPKNNFQGTRKRYNKDTYIEALEKYIDYLESIKILKPNELKGVSNNEQKRSYCKGKYYLFGNCQKYGGACSKGNCDYWQ